MDSLKKRKRLKRHDTRLKKYDTYFVGSMWNIGEILVF